MSTANERRFRQLVNAALNLGMKQADADFYAEPLSSEALANDLP